MRDAELEVEVAPELALARARRRRQRGMLLAGLCLCLCGASLWLVLSRGGGDPQPKPRMSFHVVQYNIFGRPYEVSHDGQNERLHQIPASLQRISRDIDVVTFAEADIEHERAEMLERFRLAGFPYVTSVLHDPDPFTSLVNGGVLVVSRWPILREGQHVYRHACHYADCLAAKGVKYARVLKTVDGISKIFNIFATHMQAWSTPEGRAARIAQAHQMRAFVDAFHLPHHEPIILAGDFNVDNHTFRDEVTNLVRLLKARVPQRIGDQIYSSDPRSNLLVGRDGAASSNKCYAQYVQSWGPDQNKTYHPSMLTRLPCGQQLAVHSNNSPVYLNPDAMCFCTCCPREWIDYVLVAKSPFQQPVGVATLEARVHQVTPFLTDWSAPKSHMKLAMFDLSDHYPVLGQFEFEVDRRKNGDDDASTFHLDGCSTDADCEFSELDMRCWCSGPHCYYKGKAINGRDVDARHPVNRNCLFQKTSLRCLCGPT